MKAVVFLLLLTMAACTDQRHQAASVPYLSPLAHDLAVCAIAARDSASWSAEERLARSTVNASAAAGLLVKDYASIDQPTARAVIEHVMQDPANSRADPEGWYLAECV